jgi:hypothetical protein
VLNFGDETQVIKTEPRIRNGERQRERERGKERDSERRKCMLMEMKARNVS